MFRTLTLVALMCTATLACAQGQKNDANKPLQISVTTSKVYLVGKKEEKLETTSAKIGDTLEYELTYKNTSWQPITNVKAALPIAEGYTYVEGSAKPAPLAKPVNGYVVWNLGTMKQKAIIKVVARLKLTSRPSAPPIPKSSAK